MVNAGVPNAIESRGNFLSIWTNFRPVTAARDKHAHLEADKFLLVPEILVRRDEEFKAFRHRQR